MTNLLKKLNEPFPESPSRKEHLKILLGISLFVTFFLYLFEPFQLSTYPQDSFWICAAFGFITFLVSIIHDFITERILNLQKDVPSWTLWKWIVDMIGLVFFISIGNYLFIASFNWHTFEWFSFFMMLYSTFAIGIFPIVFSGMMIQMRANQQNQLQASSLQSNLSQPKSEAFTKSVTLLSQNNSQSLSLSIPDLLYLEAKQNYVLIYYRQEEQLTQMTLRNTITKMEEQLSNTTLIRCHRSFIVNTSLIEKMAGNAQGLRLNLKDVPDIIVPVSRKYIPSLKALLS